MKEDERLKLKRINEEEKIKVEKKEIEEEGKLKAATTVATKQL